MRVNMVSFSKMGGIWLLLAILLVTLAISISFPFYKYTEGLTQSELASTGTIMMALNKYKTTVEENSQKVISQIPSLSNISQIDSIAISPIISNMDSTSTFKLQQLVALNSTSANLLNILNVAQGDNFAALMTLLNELPKNTTDEQFNKLVTQQSTTVNSIISNSNQSSPYYTINTYVQNTSATS